MCIPIIVVYGYRTKLDPLGWTARSCTRCRRVQAFECFDQMKSSHVYYIYTKEKNVGRILICDFCETSIGFAPNSQEATAMGIARAWKRKDRLQSLVDQTNPRLGQIKIPDKPTREELFALLESVNERTNPFKIETGGGYLKGAAIGAFGAALVCMLLHAIGFMSGIDLLGSALLGIFVGGFVGAVVGAIRTKFEYAKGLAQEMLVASMIRNSVPLESLQRALKHHPKTLRYAAAGVAQLTDM
ncbi:MAG TPA: hypothetical protein VGN86_00570 [Pyrinomonadaceae bacterium]|jgi:hypothetical protein|nr:hypothetical protein [Pyrinomonadaceae bacterium]